MEQKTLVKKTSAILTKSLLLKEENFAFEQTIFAFEQRTLKILKLERKKKLM